MLLCGCAAMPQDTGHAFTVIPLGVKGGIDESNLSAYMIAVHGTNDYVCLDAGTIYTGIERAVASGIFTVSAQEVRNNYIKAYLLSHPHLDHISGLLLNAPDDVAKNIYALPFCIDVLKDKYFTWRGWANFADAGDTPRLNKYRYVTLLPEKETPVEKTEMGVTAFPLSHSNPYQSTAFLVRHAADYMVYLGDTGADSVEKSDNLQRLWRFIDPLIRTKKLKAIFIEVSFPDEQPVKQLFGHLTPKLLMKEMHVLSKLTGITAISGFTVVITHRKPLGDHEEKIMQQLAAQNDLHLSLIFPQQAKKLTF